MKKDYLESCRVLFFGNGLSHQDKSEIKRLKLDVVLVGNNSKVNFDGLKESIFYDKQSAKQLIEQLERIKFVPQAIRTNTEEFVILKAQLCQYYGIPYISPETASAVVEKHIMRERLRKNAPHVSPSYKIVKSEVDIDSFVEEYGFPIMLKPSALDRSLLVTKATTLNEAYASFKEITSRLNSLYEGRLNKLTPTVLVEQYMVGSKYSVEGIVDSSGKLYAPNTVTDLWFGFDIGIDDPMNHLRIAPSQQSQDMIDELIACAQDGVRGLELVSTPIHAELIMTQQGAKIIEIAARVGGYRQEMYQSSLGISLFEQELKMQLFDKVNMKDTKNKTFAAAFKVYATEEGVLEGIDNLEFLERIKGSRLKIKSTIGSTVGPSKLGYHEVLFCVYTAPTYEEIKAISDKATRFVKAKVRIR